MKILLASSEVHPFSKTGGLADMVGALAKTLSRTGHDVALVTPLYLGIRAQFPEMARLDWLMELPLGRHSISGEVWSLKVPDGFVVYFVDQPDFFERSGLYQAEGADYSDNAERFVFFSKAVVEITRRWKPDLVHVHDWQAGLVPLFIQHERLFGGWPRAPHTCTTIHNLAYQGNFPVAKYALTNLPWEYFNPQGVEFYGQMNCLKAGIAFADAITTVSPRYAREITTTEYGCGLDGLLRHRRHVMRGILNGVDYDEWNTTHNPHLKFPYSAENLEGKGANKVELQRELGLPVNAAIPMFGSVTRLVDQKGMDILISSLEEMLGAEMQFVLLGSGAAAFERSDQDMARRHSSKVAVRIGYNHGLSHRIEAASDFFLMPSRFEPCGLNQMYSLRYGTIPIVRITGGLDDTVVDIVDDADRADGIKFGEYSSRALAKAIRKALALFAEPELRHHYILNAMHADFSWDRTAQEYCVVYRKAIGV